MALARAGFMISPHILSKLAPQLYSAYWVAHSHGETRRTRSTLRMGTYAEWLCWRPRRRGAPQLGQSHQHSQRGSRSRAAAPGASSASPRIVRISFSFLFCIFCGPCGHPTPEPCAGFECGWELQLPQLVVCGLGAPRHRALCVAPTSVRSLPPHLRASSQALCTHTAHLVVPLYLSGRHRLRLALTPSPTLAGCAARARSHHAIRLSSATNLQPG